MPVPSAFSREGARFLGSQEWLWWWSPCSFLFFITTRKVGFTVISILWFRILNRREGNFHRAKSLSVDIEKEWGRRDPKRRGHNKSWKLKGIAHHWAMEGHSIGGHLCLGHLSLFLWEAGVIWDSCLGRCYQQTVFWKDWTLEMPRPLRVDFYRTCNRHAACMGVVWHDVILDDARKKFPFIDKRLLMSKEYRRAAHIPVPPNSWPMREPLVIITSTFISLYPIWLAGMSAIL